MNRQEQMIAGSGQAHIGGRGIHQVQPVDRVQIGVAVIDGVISVADGPDISVGSDLAIEIVGSRSPNQLVIPVPAIKAVIATKAVEVVPGPVGAIERIVAGGALDDRVREDVVQRPDRPVGKRNLFQPIARRRRIELVGDLEVSRSP